MITALFHGFLLSFTLILPLGVQNIFVFNQGVTHRKLLRAVPAVVTASLCDTLLIILAVQGVSLALLNAPALRTFLIIGGCIFMLYMAWTLWRKPSSPDAPLRQDHYAPYQQIIFACSVSLLNPHAILDTIGVIGVNSLNYQGVSKLAFTTSCIAVSWLWFSLLTILGHSLGRLYLNDRMQLIINRISALTVAGAGVYMLSNNLPTL